MDEGRILYSDAPPAKMVLIRTIGAMLVLCGIILILTQLYFLTTGVLVVYVVEGIVISLTVGLSFIALGMFTYNHHLIIYENKIKIPFSNHRRIIALLFDESKTPPEKPGRILPCPA